jgi:hypothetical protein
VTLVTLTPEGFTQTVTFTPAAAMTALDIARTLELARQNLIARGIGRPTAQQLAVALAGGALPTAVGALPVVGLVPIVVPASTAASASIAPAPRFTSDSPQLRNTSDSPPPAVPAVPLFNTSASPTLGTSASPPFNTSNSPVLAPSAGGPSPAAQMQNRR